MSGFTLADLAALIASRASAIGDTSYTKALLDAGQGRAAKKLGEEAAEVLIAAIQGDKTALKLEAADLIYHLLVVLHIGGVPLQDVITELERRTARSGHEEKSARTR